MPIVLQKQSLEKRASAHKRQSGNKPEHAPAVSRSNFFAPSIQLNPGPGFPLQTSAGPVTTATQPIIQRQSMRKTPLQSPWDQLSSFDKQLMIKSFCAFRPELYGPPMCTTIAMGQKFKAHYCLPKHKRPAICNSPSSRKSAALVPEKWIKKNWIWKKTSPQACYNDLANYRREHFDAFTSVKASLQQFGFWKYVELLADVYRTSGKRSILSPGIKFIANPTLASLLKSHPGFCQDNLVYHAAKQLFSKGGAGGHKWRQTVPTWTTGLHIEPGPVYDAHLDILSPVQGKHGNGTCLYHLGASLTHFLYDEKHKEAFKHLVIEHQNRSSPWQIPGQEKDPYPASFYLHLGVRF